MGKVYHVYIKKEGLNQEATELFFNLNGKLLKKIGEEGEEEENLEVETPKPKPIITVPDSVNMMFNRRYPKAEDVVWEKEYGDYIAKFEDNGYNARAKYTTGGEWISYTVEIDANHLYSPIMSYIYREYRGYNPIFAEKTTRKDRKDYYYVEIINKKKSTGNVELYFNKAGRYIEEPPE